MNTTTHNGTARLAAGVVLGLVLLAGGCNSQPYVTPERLDRGLVMVLTGIEGRSVLNEAIADGLDRGGVDCAIEITDWTSRWGMWTSLSDEQRNRKVAGTIAERVHRYQLAYPERPVTLVGHSGGGGMVVYTAEQFTDTKLAGVILLNGAISKDYCLTKALANTERGIVNIYSQLDLIVRLGTLFAGTMDRRHSASAGSVGFIPPATAGPEYDKLFQIGWTKEMIESFHIGNHFSSASVFYSARYIAPLVRARVWDQRFVDFVKTGQGRAALQRMRDEEAQAVESEDK